jgi:hypothetical protein
VSGSVAVRIADVTSTEYKQEVDMIIYRAILGAFQMARKQIAVPGVGTMTFDQAKPFNQAGVVGILDRERQSR